MSVTTGTSFLFLEEIGAHFRGLRYIVFCIRESRIQNTGEGKNAETTGRSGMAEGFPFEG